MTDSIRLLGLALLLGSGASLSAQSQDSSLEKSFIQVTTSITPHRQESSRVLLINEKGMALTPWRNVCLPGKLTCNGSGLTTSVKLIGVHPTRDLALLQVEFSKTDTQYAPKPAKLAKAPVSPGDKIFMFQYMDAIPGIVSSETQPVGNPECFWITGRDAKPGVPWPGGYGSSPRPDNWVTNLQGEVQGVVARVIVNGKLTLRVIPVHDVKPEDFVPLAQKKPNPQKAQELIQIADGLQKDLERNRFRPAPFEVYTPEVGDYLRQALAEDPTNKDLHFRMGVIRDDSKPAPGSAPAARRLPDPAEGKSDEQVRDEFLRTRLAIAVEHINGGRTKLAKGILDDIIASNPKTAEAKVAQSLLESIKDPK